jgi:hypothetical protein
MAQDDLMIELAPTEQDDADFLPLVQGILNGAVAAMDLREAYLVQTDNWFDWKWLGFWSRGENKELLNKALEKPMTSVASWPGGRSGHQPSDILTRRGRR